MAIDKKSFKKIFPNLSKEIDELDECKVPINAVRADPEVAEKEAMGEEVSEEEFLKPVEVTDKFRHFNPSAVDFIRRCDTEEQAQEIISYLQKKGELTEEQAKELECKLKREGVRCFGPKKEENYYFREGGIY
jgi:hypothetical protein